MKKKLNTEKLFVFTVHKAGSVGLQNFLAKVAEEADVPHHYASSKVTPLPDTRTNDDPRMIEALKGKTGIIGPLRRPVDLPESERSGSKTILHLRDPRDGLVSMYFSWVYNHTGIPDAARQAWEEQGIDAFVIENTPDYRDRYRSYIENYLGKEDCRLLYYEDFVVDREKWTREFCDFTGFPFENRFVQNFNRNKPNLEALANNEDPQRHVRKAIPGDYKVKLTPETIATLNDLWSDVLSALNYR